MTKLEDKIDNVDQYTKMFNEWEVTENIIDDKKAIWEIKKTDSNCRKVCMYRDGRHVMIYGDYGSYVFDSMTWVGSVYNLEYDNIGYQFEKLSRESKESVFVFDDYACEEDIWEWFKEILKEQYYFDEDNDEHIWKNADNLSKFIQDELGFLGRYLLDEDDIYEFCNENELADIKKLIVFLHECLSHVEEYEWISFLRSYDWGSISDFEEQSESSLWNAGKRVVQNYYVSLYALKICGEKLKEENNK